METSAHGDPFAALPEAVLEHIIEALGPHEACASRLWAVDRRFSRAFYHCHWDRLEVGLPDPGRADRLVREMRGRDYRMHGRGQEARDRWAARSEASRQVAAAAQRAHGLARHVVAGRFRGARIREARFSLRFEDGGTPVEPCLERRAAGAALALLSAAAAAGAPLRRAEIDLELRFAGEGGGEDEEEEEEGGYGGGCCSPGPTRLGLLYDALLALRPCAASLESISVRLPAGGRARPEPSRLAAHLYPFSALRSLELSEFVCLRAEHISAICSAVPSLRSISFSPASREDAEYASCAPDGALAGTGPLLESIELRCGPDMQLGAGLAALAAAAEGRGAPSRLRRLACPTGLLSEDALEALTRLPSLESLQCSVDGGEPLSAAAAARLGAHPTLRSLSLDLSGPASRPAEAFLEGLAAGVAGSRSLAELRLVVRGPALAALLSARPGALSSLSLCGLRLDGGGPPAALALALAGGGYDCLEAVEVRIESLPPGGEEQAGALAPLAAGIARLPRLSDLRVAFDLQPAPGPASASASASAAAPPPPILEGPAAAALARAAPRALRAWAHAGPFTIGYPSLEELGALAACPNLRRLRLRLAAESEGSLRLLAALRGPGPGPSGRPGPPCPPALDLLVPPHLEPFARGLLAAALPGAPAPSSSRAPAPAPAPPPPAPRSPRPVPGRARFAARKRIRT
eukprot:tig00020557_g11109.t1